jgi:hypothetical protein
LTPLEDQQLAGVIMWIPGGMLHAIVALVYLGRWLRLPPPALPTLVMPTYFDSTRAEILPAADPEQSLTRTQIHRFGDKP